jgi:DNA repair exonuclease SbcCD ATPase subunit/DNA repair exonuclease SbcCD nuclease subunit
MVLIAHLADIHIQDRRRPVYADIFNQLYDKLKECKVDIIVVAGDIFDNKMRASANNLMDVTAFLTNLANIAPVVAIAGNHDTNCLIPDSLDLLTPLLRENRHLQPPRFNYWRHSGVYYAHNIIWTVIATDGEQPSVDIENEVKKVYPNSKHICLFHEEVNNAKMPNGAIISNFKLNIQNFERYDISMGGHIHNRQFFAPNAAYCGSLIQQNIGEKVTGHGFLLWDTENIANVQGIDILSDRGFIRVRIDKDGNDVTEHPIPSNPEYWEVVYAANTVDSERVQMYSKKFDSQPRAVRTDETLSFDESTTEPATHENIQQIQIAAAEMQTHEAIICEILAGDENLNDVLEMHREKYVPQQYISGGKFRLLNIAFDNMYAFGTDNYVDFTKLEKCVSGVIAPNHTGKSSLIDTILFALYDEHPRSSVKKDIINIDAQLCKVRLEFELDGKQGYIEKGFSSKNKSAITGMYKFHYAGEELTQGSVTGTNAEIKRVLGSADIALSSSFQIQGGEYSGFVTASPADRKRILANVLSLGIFDDIEKNITKEMTIAGAEMKTLDKQRVNIDDLADQITKSEISQEELDNLDKMQATIKKMKYDREDLIYEIAQYTEETDKPFDEIPLDEMKKYIQETKYILTEECLPLTKLRSELHEITFNLTQFNKNIGELDNELCKLSNIEVDDSLGECEFNVEWPIVKIGPKPDIYEYNMAMEFMANNSDLYELRDGLFTKSEKWNLARFTYLSTATCDVTETIEELINKQNTINRELHSNTETKAKAMDMLEKLGTFAEKAMEKYPNIVHKTIEDPEKEIIATKELLAVVNQVSTLSSGWSPNDGCKSCGTMCAKLKAYETKAAETKLKQLETQLEKYKAGQLRKVKEVIAKKISSEKSLQKDLAEISDKMMSLNKYLQGQRELSEIEKAREFYDKLNEVERYIDIIERAAYYYSESKKVHKVKYSEIQDQINEKTIKVNELRHERDDMAKKCEEIKGKITIISNENNSIKSKHLVYNGRVREILSFDFNEITETLDNLTSTAASIVSNMEARKINKSRLTAQYEIEQVRNVEYKKASHKYDVLKSYKSILRPNGGIADRLLESARNTFTKKLNEALRELGAKFNVEINDKFEMYISMGQMHMIPSGLASGYQKFVLGLSTRLAIWRLSAIPRPDAFIIDEGFGACDEDYLELMANALESLSAAPDGPKLVFIVSHVDMLKTRLERSIDLITGPPTKVDNRQNLAPIVRASVRIEPIITTMPEFWCADCQQQLKTSLTYDKHILSAKHIKNAQKK